MHVMKTFVNHAALLCCAVLGMPGALAAGVPVHVLAPNSCWAPERPKLALDEKKDEGKDERSRRRTDLLLRECGLVDSDKEVDEHLNDGESVKDPWKKADDIVEFSRQYNQGDEHQLLGPGTHLLHPGGFDRGTLRVDDSGHGRLRLDGPDSVVAALPDDQQRALPEGAVPAVPEPSAYLTMGAGLLLLGARAWYRRRHGASAKATAN